MQPKTITKILFFSPPPLSDQAETAMPKTTQTVNKNGKGNNRKITETLPAAAEFDSTADKAVPSKQRRRTAASVQELSRGANDKKNSTIKRRSTKRLQQGVDHNDSYGGTEIKRRRRATVTVSRSEERRRR
ncbi:hypothetical protein M9H77_34414 [Catharanthus roseus]|uniref:Uncharacterized protein n=1 Tax=Catharanthus roseus TaxID=4058 RepID=A0ACB9ZL48_CATRO|nr:hypothetical protein M9H77_34414 [Catharanthus roseus]